LGQEFRTDTSTLCCCGGVFSWGGLKAFSRSHPPPPPPPPTHPFNILLFHEDPLDYKINFNTVFDEGPTSRLTISKTGIGYRQILNCAKLVLTSAPTSEFTKRNMPTFPKIVLFGHKKESDTKERTLRWDRSNRQLAAKRHINFRLGVLMVVTTNNTVIRPEYEGDKFLRNAGRFELHSMKPDLKINLLQSKHFFTPLPNHDDKELQSLQRSNRKMAAFEILPNGPTEYVFLRFRAS
jgi:hypothetical protein